MRGIVSADHTNGQEALLEIDDSLGRRAYAQVVIGLSKTFTPKGYIQITAASLATGGMIPVPEGAEYVIVQAEGGRIRWRDDMTMPTATKGMLIRDGGELDYDGDPSMLMLIGVDAGVIANITYYGP